jgi:hypothetical protein
VSTPPIDPNDSATRSWRSWKGWIGFILGLGLLIAAAVVLSASPGMIDQLWTNLRHAPYWAIAVIISGPFLSWILVGMCLHMLLRRHGSVGRFEMLMLVGSAWLLNHLPMRPGLIGRVGYHKLVNNIRVRDAVEATVWSLVFSVLSNGLIVGLVLLVPKDMSTAGQVGVLCGPAAVVGATGMVVGVFSTNSGRLIGAFAMRYGDVLIWLLRYGAVFAALGLDASAVQIAMIAAVSQFAQLIPITGGGLGFREWGVGITARQGGHAMEAAIGADLINRAVETLWVLPIGFYSTWWVARSLRRHSATSGVASQTEDATPSQ